MNNQQSSARCLLFFFFKSTYRCKQRPITWKNRTKQVWYQKASRTQWSNMIWLSPCFIPRTLQPCLFQTSNLCTSAQTPLGNDSPAHAKSYLKRWPNMCWRLYKQSWAHFLAFLLLLPEGCRVLLSILSLLHSCSCLIIPILIPHHITPHSRALYPHGLTAC